MSYSRGADCGAATGDCDYCETLSHISMCEGDDWCGEWVDDREFYRGGEDQVAMCLAHGGRRNWTGTVLYGLSRRAAS